MSFVSPSDDCNLTAVTQRDREEVLDVAVVLRALGPVFGRHEHLPGRFHVFEPELGRRRRFLLQELRHDVDLFLREFAGSAPVRHTRRRTVGNQRLEIIGAFRKGDVRRQRLARSALAQHAVASRAALEIELGGPWHTGLRSAPGRPHSVWLWSLPVEWAKACRDSAFRLRSRPCDARRLRDLPGQAAP